MTEKTAGDDPVATVVADGAGAFPAEGEPGSTLRRLADDLAAPLEVAICGRTRQGPTAVAAILADEPVMAGADDDIPAVGAGYRVVDLPSIDVLDHPDPDLDRDILVYVIDDGLRDPDRRVITGRDPAATVVVLAALGAHPGVVDPSPVDSEAATADVESVRAYLAGLGAAAPVVVEIPTGGAGDRAAAAEVIRAVEACRSAALRRRYLRAIDVIEDSAITHRFARDRLEGLLQRIAAARGVDRR